MPFDNFGLDWWRQQLNPVANAESFDPEGIGYDIESAKTAGMQPIISPEDQKSHWGSVIPTSPEESERLGLPKESYLMLKGKKHETWSLAVEAEEKRGYKIIKKGDRYYSVPKMQLNYLPEEIDEFTASVYGEAAGEPYVGQLATASTLYNRLQKEKSIKEALQKSSSAYKTKSPQYVKAKTGNLNLFERIVYNRISRMSRGLMSGEIKPSTEATHFENIEAFGTPKWAKEMENVGKFGRQTFFK